MWPGHLGTRYNTKLVQTPDIDYNNHSALFHHMFAHSLTNHVPLQNKQDQMERSGKDANVYPTEQMPHVLD